MRFRGTLILLALALIAGAVYLFYILPQTKQQKMIDELSGRFFRVDVADVEFLRIQNPRGTFNIAKEGGQWKITSPAIFPTDKVTIQKVLEIITKGKIIKLITDDMGKLPEFGLDRPSAALFIGYRGKIDELVIGGSNPSGTGSYAFGRGINAVFIVDKEIAEIATVELYDLRSKSVFDFPAEAVTDVQIIRKEGNVELKKDGSVWQVTRPFSGRAGEDDVKEFLLGVLNQRADEFYDNTIPERNNFSDTVRLIFTSGGNISADIDVHYWGTGADQGTVAYQKGMRYSGRLPRDFWNFVSRDAASFRYRNLFSFNEDEVQKAAVRMGDAHYELIRKGSDWYIDGRQTDRKKAMGLIWFLKSWRASSLLESALSSFKEPVSEISLSGGNGKIFGTVKVYGKLKDELIGYTADEPQFLYYAVTDNLKNPCAVSSIDLKKIPDKEEFMK